MQKVSVVGGGLAGSEIALQLAGLGYNVDLIEMRPSVMTEAHKTSYLAELVCSNSLKSTRIDNASGLLKRELSMLGCRLLDIADESKVPAGHALAVDREIFASNVTRAVKENKLINRIEDEIRDIQVPGCCVIATGPLTSQALSKSIQNHFSEDHLFFYDAISISINIETADTGIMFKASRYGKGEADYFNIPFTKEEYYKLVEFLISAQKTEKHNFEQSSYFEACLPVEIAAKRGPETLRYGIMKPKGLIDPSTGIEPYAVIQLRQETRSGEMYGLVGFQSRLKRKAQRELLGIIPGLKNADILRWASIHRNTYIDSPRLLDERQMSRTRDGLFFAGQITGVEGYVESIAHGVLISRNVIAYLKGEKSELFPKETILGAIQRYLINTEISFQPINANLGLLPMVKGKKKDRKSIKAQISIDKMTEFLKK